MKTRQDALYAIADYVIRVIAIDTLINTNFIDQTNNLRDLPKIIDVQTANTAADAAKVAYIDSGATYATNYASRAVYNAAETSYYAADAATDITTYVSARATVHATVRAAVYAANAANATKGTNCYSKYMRELFRIAST